MADYGAAVAAYYAAVTSLEQGMIAGSTKIYLERRKAAEEARALCEDALKALDEHEGKHKC